MTKISNVRKATKFKRSIRAISPVIATLLMIAIAVVASLVVYAWVTGYMGFQTNKAGKAIALPSFTGVANPGTPNVGNLVVYVQNVGQGTVEVSAVYVDDILIADAALSYNPTPPGKVISETNTVEVTIAGSFDLTIKHNIKVTTTEGTFMTITGKVHGSNTQSLTVDIIGSGTIEKNPDQATYAINTPVLLTATPAQGWTFAGWSGDLITSINPDTVIIDANPQVTATFTQLEYSLTVTSNPTDTGSVGLSNNGPYHYNDVVTLTATSATGYTFSSWAGDLTGSTNPKDITITGNMIVTAEFAANPVTLTLGSPTGGDIAATQAGPYHYGDSVELTATADPGYSFSTWTNDLTSSTNPDSIILNGDKSVSATFTQNPVNLIQNPGFETSSSWTTSQGNGGISGAQDSTWKNSGTYSGKTDTRNPNNNNAHATLTQTLTSTRISAIPNTIGTLQANIHNAGQANNGYNVVKLSISSSQGRTITYIWGSNPSDTSNINYVYMGDVSAISSNTLFNRNLYADWMSGTGFTSNDQINKIELRSEGYYYVESGQWNNYYYYYGQYINWDDLKLIYNP